MSSSIKRNIVTGFLWSVFGQVGYLGVAFITNILLVRILGPYEFGQIGIIMFFVAIGKVLTESGLSGALVRKNDATEEDFSTVFIFNLIISFVLVAVIIVMSGYVADFYKDTSLENILIVSSMVLLIDAFRIPQNAKLVKELKFKKKAAYEFTAIFFSAIIAVILAIKGAGVWAIVTMQLLTAILLTSLLWIFEGSLNQFVFRKKSFLALYKFGVNTTLASILNTAFDNIYQLILGKYFSVNLTGLFYQGKKLQEIPVGVIKSTTLGVVFASLSKVQHDITEFGNLYKRIITLFTIVVGLICLLVYYYAENIILLLYGKEWIEAVFFVQILIISSFFYLQEIFNRVIFKVFDKTEKILYLEVLKKCIQAATIIIGVIFMDIELLLYLSLIHISEPTRPY